MATPESEVFDPTTPAARLAELAASHPQFGIAIVNHPNAYPALIGWIAQHGDAASRAAAATRISAAAQPAAPTAPTAPVTPAAPVAPRRPLGFVAGLLGWLQAFLRVWRGDAAGALATPGELRSKGAASLVLLLAPVLVNAILLGFVALVLVNAPFAIARSAFGAFGSAVPGASAGAVVGAFFAGFGFSLVYVALRALGLIGIGAIRRVRIAPLAALETVAIGAGAGTPLALLAFAFSFLGFGGIDGLIAAGVLYVLFGLVGVLLIEDVARVWLGERLGAPVPSGLGALAGALPFFIAYGCALWCLSAAMQSALSPF